VRYSVPMIHAVTRILIHRQARLLQAFGAELEESCYPALLGRNVASDKTVEGDEATPLGEFYICAKNPRSRFFLSMCISYPNAEDAERGLAAGLITTAQRDEILEAVRRRILPPQGTRLGGEIYIHGEEPGGRAGAAGTRGCIALANGDMRELYEATALGTPVHIVP